MEQQVKDMICEDLGIILCPQCENYERYSYLKYLSKTKQELCWIQELKQRLNGLNDLSVKRFFIDLNVNWAHGDIKDITPSYHLIECAKIYYPRHVGMFEKMLVLV